VSSKSLLAASLAFVAAAASAQVVSPPAIPADDQATRLPTVEVIGVSPVLGSGVERDKVPANTRSFSQSDIARDGTPDLSGLLDRRIPSVNINGVQDSPFQPDVQYRGFDASPVLGTPQGLAVYQNGVRINEVFGDTVNWDLVPDFAINRVNLVSANPVFGLNALGGALAIEMKNGFNAEGGQMTLSGGSFGRRDGILEYGVHSGALAGYIGGRVLYEEGWRDHSPSSLHQLYTDLGGEGERGNLHLTFAGASNLINAIGPTPAQLLAGSRSAIFTSPQSTRNDLGFLTLSGGVPLSDALDLGGNVYWRRFRQHIANGNTSDAVACDPAVAVDTLCFGDNATVLFATNGQPVPNFLGGLDPGQIDRTSTVADGLGGSLQLTRKTPLFGHGNHLVTGFSLDHGAVRYRANSEIGTIQPNLLVSGSGLIIDQPAGDLAPVSLDTTSSYYGAFASDTFDLSDRLSATLSGRYNLALLRLEDLGGSNALSSNHRFSRFNPALGATFKLTPNVTAYGGYAETNRTPTPGELGCADPTRPCLIDNFVVSDPDLKQVVARTWELGLRGNWRPEETSRLTWSVGLYRTDNQDDILNVPSSVTGFGFFENVGRTRRQGIDASIAYTAERWSGYVDYSLVDATFRSSFTLSSPTNPFADANGLITVRPGNHLPSIPEHRLKTGAEYKLTPDWTVGGDLVVASGQYFRGDESNQNPKIPGYYLVNLRTSYEISDNIELFGKINNVFNTKYETFGIFFDPTQVPSLGLSDPRSLSPGTPLAAYAGLRITF
jgi:iron complex outermembrane receptor protein